MQDLNEGSNLTEEVLKYAEASLPTFIHPDFIRDAEGRRPSDPNYDQTTLYVPIEAFQKLTPMFRQYWNAKKLNFDSVVFFRCGRWNTVMYSDAILIARLFNRNLGFWGKDRPCLTVYESQFPLYSRTLLEMGRKLMMVEQLEKADLSNKEEGEVVRREITQIISRGTNPDYDDEQYEARCLMVVVEAKAPVNLKEQRYCYGVAIVDCTTNSFYLDQFFDDAHANHLRSLVYKLKPLEVILRNVDDQTEKMIK